MLLKVILTFVETKHLNIITMSKNPKLEFYKVNLNAINPDDFLTFRQVFKKIKEDYDEILGEKNSEESNFSDLKLMMDFYRHFFSVSAGTFKNELKNKAFSVKPATANEEDIVKLNNSKYFIHGLMKGGEYRTGKSIGEIEDPDKKPEKLTDGKVITDDFYFLLYTPLDSNIGVLILQSYTKDSINDIFRPFVEHLFKVKGLSLKAVTSIFMPKSMQEDFKSNSYIKSFNYSQRILVSGIEDQNILDGEFTVNVEIKALNNNVNLSNLSAWRKRLGNAILGLPNETQRNLSTFDKKKGYINSSEGKSTATPFELDAATIEINPTIFLQNEINLEENGVPIWQELEDFAILTLDSIIKPEVYPDNYLNADN